MVYCWRGGDRSGSLAHALSRIGWHVALLQGGYKAYRKLVREALYEDGEGELLKNCVAVGGATGSAAVWNVIIRPDFFMLRGRLASTISWWL